MIGLIVFAVFIPLLIGYLWLIRATARYVKKNTGSTLIAGLAVFGILMIAFGDTLFNRWYHREVLCQRDDVGTRIFERVALPAIYVDKNTLKPRFPLPLDQPFFSDFSTEELRTYAGSFPFTAHGRIERRIVDKTTGRVLMTFVNYYPSGGPWWAFPVRWFGESSLIGWLHSRQQISTCFDGPDRYSLLGVSEYFRAINKGELK